MFIEKISRILTKLD